MPLIHIRSVLPSNWFTEIIVPGVDPKQPGIYEWCIESVGLYIGQYKNASRPRQEYGRNVANILSGRPYRKNKPDRFRIIHRKLAEAIVDQQSITLSLIENVVDEVERNRRERELIADRRHWALQGGLPVLNSNPLRHSGDLKLSRERSRSQAEHKD